MQKDSKMTGNEQIDKLIAAETQKIKGFVLKRVSVTTTKNKGSKDEVSRVTTEVTRIKKAKLADSLFSLPSGYKELSASPMMPGGMGRRPSARDSRNIDPEQMDAMRKMMEQFQGLKD